jgi:hypothetical protein
LNILLSLVVVVVVIRTLAAVAQVVIEPRLGYQ